MKAKEFFSLLYGADFTGFLNLWRKQDKASGYYSCDEVEQAASGAEESAKTKDVYVALSLTVDKRAKHQRGTEDRVVAVPGFFADIDFAESKKSDKKYPPSQQAMTILEALPIQPTITTHTGNGLHALYLFDQLLLTPSEETRRAAQQLSKAFQSYIHDAFKQHGYELDSVGELSRNIRIPGTLNHKSLPPKPVEAVYYAPDKRYTLQQMQELLQPLISQQMKRSSAIKSAKYTLADHNKIVEECAWYRNCVENAVTCDEPNWYAAASITARCKDGLNIFRQYSSQYAGYNTLEALRKFARSNDESGPRTCKSIYSELGNQSHCSTCRHWRKITTPIQLGQSRRIFNEYEPGETGPLPLGFTKEGLYALRDQSRNIICCSASNQLLSFQHLLAFAPSYFWQEQFPVMGGRSLFNAIGAGEALINACRQVGPFNPRKVRGRGVWLEGTREIINLGNPVPADAEYTYLCFEPIPIQKQDAFNTQRLLELFQRFNWRNPQDALLLLGWLAIAPICGMLRNRPHCFIYGPPRTGKTTVHTIVSRLLGMLVIAADGQSTEAGLRQMLGPDSLPIIIDEFESDQQGGRLRAIMRLARSAYSAETSVFRGTPEGKALQFSLRTIFFYAAVNPIGMEPADESRTLLLEMVMHNNDEAIAIKIAEEEEYFMAKGDEWCGYMISNAAKINPAIALFKQALPGIDNRHRTNVATLLAGAFVALHGHIPLQEEAQALAAEFKNTIDLHAQALDRDDSMECLHYLFSHVVEHHTIAQWLAGEVEASRRQLPASKSASSRILATFGIKVKLDGEEAGFFIMNGSPAVDKVFASTKWGGRAWERALRKLPGSFHPTIPMYFATLGKKARCLGLPLDLIPEALGQLPTLDNQY